MRRSALTVLMLMVVPAVALADSDKKGGYDIVWDDFRDGFTVDSPTAKWFHFAAGPFVGNDGIVTTSNKGLRVRSAGTNPSTGKPAFTLTLAPESQNGGLPGGLDHVKWLVYMNHLSSAGYPGFDAEPGKVLSCEGTIGGETFGTENHPFGPLVENPQSDLRLAATAFNALDFETFSVFDFLITNDTVYAVYERLPFGRGPVLGNYAAFTHQIPVGKNKPGKQHKMKISYDRSKKIVTWHLDGKEVLRVTKVGRRLDRSLITLDHGGEEVDLELKQFDCGMGMFTILDGFRPSDIGLVKLSEVPNTYYDPSVGEPTPAAFYDDYSQASNRLWGQGAELTVKNYSISSEPSDKH